jgi:hypothetical protein
VALPAEVRQSRPCAVHVTEKIRFDYAAKILVRNLLEIAIQSNYSVVDPNIESSESFKSLSGEVADRILVRDICYDTERFNSEGTACPCDFIQRVLA